MLLLHRPANRGANTHHPVGGKRNPIKPRHDRVSIDNPLVQPRRTRAA